MPLPLCAHCQKPFYPRRSEQTYCTRSCKASAQAYRTSRKHNPDLHCEWCGVAFFRRPSNRDARRFCSKRCSGARRRARTAERRAAILVQRRIAREKREQIRKQQHQARMICPCGARISRRTGRWCNTCFAQQIGNGIRAGHTVARTAGLHHLCPNCGQWFRGYPRDTFCSTTCAKQMRKRDRYPHLGHLPIDERNQLAELIALVRAVNRRLHTRGQNHGEKHK
jgi:hypothetical protein